MVAHRYELDSRGYNHDVNLCAASLITGGSNADLLPPDSAP